MHKNAIIIHGAFGYPEENWFPWMKENLERLGYEIHVPAFPTPEGQTFDGWLQILRQYTLDNETIMIGHSTGALFIPPALQALKKSVKAAFLIAPFMHALGHPMFDALNESFVAQRWCGKNSQKMAGHFFVYYSDNDPYIPAKESKDFARRLNAKTIEIAGAGHFNSAAGYIEFPDLLHKITTL